MKKALKLYHECHSQLTNESLSWENFNKQASDLTTEYEAMLEDDEIPWPPDEVIGKFHQLISGIRESKSQKWMENLDDRINHIDSMTASQANQLMRHLQKPPLYLTSTN